MNRHMGNSLNSQEILELKGEENFRNRDHVKSCPFWVLPRREKARQQELTAKLGCDATRIDFKQRLCRVDQFVSVPYLMHSEFTLASRKGHSELKRF